MKTIYKALLFALYKQSTCRLQNNQIYICFWSELPTLRSELPTSEGKSRV